MTKFYGRKLSIFLLLLIVGVLGFYSPFIRNFFVAFSTTIQTFYLDTKEKIEEVTARHFLQSQTIERLRQQVHQLEQEMLTCRYDAHKYHID